MKHSLTGFTLYLLMGEAINVVRFMVNMTDVHLWVEILTHGL